MALPAPNLDDRRFQDLVDDAKRLVQQRCPEWTDHNVSDPGVTLIEAVAFMVDQLGYRLNRVPERNYLRFLDLIGVRLYPPTAARAGVTFWLSAPQPAPVLVPADTPVCTSRTENPDLETVVFATTQELAIVPCTLEKIMTAGRDGAAVDQTERLRFGGLDQFVAGDQGIASFGSPPQAGDTLLFGLSAAVPRCAVLLRLDCDVEGVGVDPEAPPLVWEAWDGEKWVACEVDRDETGGLNRPGDIVVHVPAEHTNSVINREQAGWLRCRVVAPVEGQPFYSDPPQVRAATAATIGGTIPAVHAETIRDEILGISDGVPGQRFTTQHRPIVPGEQPLLLEVTDGDGWEQWQAVDHFVASDPADRHFMVDPMTGEVVFGPALR